MYTVRLCFLLLWLCHQFWMDSYELFIHILQGCCTGTGAIIWLAQCRWSNPNRYGSNRLFPYHNKHIKAWTMCIILDVLYILDWLYLLHSYAWNLVIQINVHEPSFQLYLYAIQGLKLTLLPRSNFLLLLSKSWSKSHRHRSYFLSLKADIWLDWVAKLCS